MDEDEALLKRITIDPEIFGGKPIIRGQRMTVEHILRWLSGGTSAEDLLDGFPFLEPDDIRAALLYASSLSSMTRLTGSSVATLQLADATAG